ncbi:MAG: cytochrome P450 [Chloroflexota bacterium]
MSKFQFQTSISHSRKSDPPYIRGLPILGNVPYLYADAISFLMKAHQTYGDIIQVDQGLLGKPYFVFHPDGVKRVLQGGFRKETSELTFMLGRGLASSATGDHWRKQRRMMQPAFHRQRLTQLTEIMTDTISHILDTQWTKFVTNRQPLDTLFEMEQLTAKVILATMFGTDMNSELKEVVNSLTHIIDYIGKRFFSVIRLPMTWPTPANRRFQQAIYKIDQIVDQLIEYRRGHGVEADDLLGLLMAAQDDETGIGMSNEQLHNEVKTMFLAGFETTSVLLTWIWYLLKQHPHIEQKLHTEISTTLGTRKPIFADIGQLTYTNMVIQETLRLYPPTWTMLRRFDKPEKIEGITIPANHTVLLCPYITHRHSEFWSEPEAFKPERFSPAQLDKQSRFAFVPFGAGPHQCIGRDLAVVEAQLIISMIMQRFRIVLGNIDQVKPLARVTLAPDRNLTMHVEYR